jgi:hypothetical protein
MFANMDWQIGVVNLERVLGFQKIVVIDQAMERVQGITRHDWDRLFTVCLPEPTASPELRGFVDRNGKALTLSSLNPNLRITGQVVQDIPGQPVKFFGFGVDLPTSFVQVAEYRGRWLLRDGYHRCYALLRNGITTVPCVFMRAKNFAETGAEQPGFFSYQILFGERPPFLTDFLNDEVSATVKQPAVRKVLRINAEEFVVEL